MQIKTLVLDTPWVSDKNSGEGSIQREKWRTSSGIGSNLDKGKARRKSPKFYAKNIGCYTTWESFNKMPIRSGKIWSRLISNSSTLFPIDLKSWKYFKANLVSKNMEAVRKISMAKNYHLARTFGLPMAPGKGPRNSYAGVLICVGGRGNRGDPYKSVEYLEAGEGKG